jgi:hypothetical protein
MDKTQIAIPTTSEIEVVRCAKGNIRIGKMAVGTKSFELIGYLPFLKSKTDYNLLFEGDYEKKKITGCVIPIWLLQSPSITNLRLSAVKELRQSTILDDTNKRRELLIGLSVFEATKPIIGDPMSEYYYYNFRKGELRKCNASMHKVVFESFLSGDENQKPDPNKYYDGWKTIVAQGHMLGIQTHNLNYQREGKVDVVLPTTTIIRSDYPESLEIAIEANRAAELAAEMNGLPKDICADYYIFHYNVFENKTFVAKIISALLDRHFNRLGKKFIFFKVINDERIEQYTYRNNFYELLSALDSIRMNTEETVVVMLNTGALGLACMGKIDAYSEPMDGQTVDKGGGGQVKTLDNMKGRWYDPKTRIFWKFTKAKEYWTERGALPAEGKYGRAAGLTDPAKQTDYVWNIITRRKHLLEERSIELELFEEEAKKNGLSAMVWLKQRLIDSETPNLSKLL